MKHQTVNIKIKTKIDWKQIAQQAYEFGQSVARKTNGGRGYQRSWNSSPYSSKKGYVAFAKFVSKALKYDCH